MANRCVVTGFDAIPLCPKTDEVWLVSSAEEAQRHLAPDYKTGFSPVYGAIQDVHHALGKTHYKGLTTPYMLLAMNFSDAMAELLRHSNANAQSDWGVLSTAIQFAGGTIPFFHDMAATAVDASTQGVWASVATPVVIFTHGVAEMATDLGRNIGAVADGKLKNLSPFKSSEFLSAQVATAAALVYLARGTGSGGSDMMSAAMDASDMSRSFAIADGSVGSVAQSMTTAKGKTGPVPRPEGLAMIGDCVEPRHPTKIAADPAVSLNIRMRKLDALDYYTKVRDLREIAMMTVDSLDTLQVVQRAIELLAEVCRDDAAWTSSVVQSLESVRVNSSSAAVRSAAQKTLAEVLERHPTMTVDKIVQVLGVPEKDFVGVLDRIAIKIRHDPRWSIVRTPFDFPASKVSSLHSSEVFARSQAGDLRGGSGVLDCLLQLEWSGGTPELQAAARGAIERLTDIARGYKTIRD